MSHAFSLIPLNVFVDSHAPSFNGLLVRNAHICPQAMKAQYRPFRVGRVLTFRAFQMLNKLRFQVPDEFFLALFIRTSRVTFFHVLPGGFVKSAGPENEWLDMSRCRC